MKEPVLKYNIDKKLTATAEGGKDYYRRVNELREKLGVCRSVFWEWRTLTVNDSKDIPAGKLKVIADYLGCTTDELFNTVVAK